MKIAVLADIHGNHIALEACMDYLEKQNVDACIFLGDYIGEFPGTEKTMKILYDIQRMKPCYLIKGNKEDYQLTGLGEGHPEWDPFPSTIGMIRYGRNHLTEKDIAFLKELPISQTVSMDGMQDIVICHGSPRKVNEKIYAGQEQNAEILSEVTEKYILCGHTHRRTNSEELSKIIWNPGSVGLPLDGSSAAQFMIIHSEGSEWKPEFLSLKYDTEKIIKEMQEEGFHTIAPYWFKITKELLRGGTVSHGTVLSRAMEICRQKNGECNWPGIPEDCWEQAYDELM